LLLQPETCGITRKKIQKAAGSPTDSQKKTAPKGTVLYFFTSNNSMVVSD
jgi:hypothetical protein